MISRPERCKRIPRRVLPAMLAVALVGVGWAGWHVASRPDRGVGRPDIPNSIQGETRILGDYGSPLTKVDHRGIARIDVPGTIDRLKSADINTYAYLVSPGPSQNAQLSQASWADLPAFAEAAGRADIAVYVYLVPPSGAKRATYRPYGWDYVSWAVAIAKVAADHPSIRGIVMDDLGANVSRKPNVDVVLTPQYLGTMMKRARETAPWLSLAPVLYEDDILGPKAILGAYRAVIDSVWFAYTAEVDSDAAEQAALQISRRVAQTIKCTDPLGCQSIRFDGGPGGSARQVLIRTSLFPETAKEVTVSVNLNTVTSAGGSVVVSISADRRPAVARRISSPGWTSVQMKLPEKHSRLESLSLRIVRGDTAQTPLDVLVTEPRLDGKPMAAQLPSDRPASAGAGVLALSSGDLPVVAMTYATPFSKNRAVLPAADVSRSMNAVASLMGEGIVDGSCIYLLNLSSRWAGGADPRSYGVVAREYRRWRQGGG